MLILGMNTLLYRCCISSNTMLYFKLYKYIVISLIDFYIFLEEVEQQMQLQDQQQQEQQLQDQPHQEHVDQQQHVDQAEKENVNVEGMNT